MDMATEVVRSIRRFEELALPWEGLRKRAGQHVFQSHGWISTWFRSRPKGDNSRLLVGVCWAGDDLAVAMPFVTRRHRGVRVLEWAAKECSDYCDAVVDRSSADHATAIEAVWKAVSDLGGFDLAYLSHVRPDAALHRLLNDAGRRRDGFRPGRRSDKSLQVQSGGADGASWFRNLSKKARNNHTRGKRIVGETGEVVVRQYGPGDDWEPVLDRMIDLKQQWLAHTAQRNRLLDDDAFALRALARELARQGEFRIFCMECGGAVVAASLNIVDDTRMAAFFSAYDPAFDRASPGTLIMVEYLMWSFDHGIAEVDFLCGEEDYKFKFANAHLDLGSYVEARTIAGRIALAVDERLDSLRQLKATLFAGAKSLPDNPQMSTN